MQGSDGRRPTETTFELVDGARRDTIGAYDVNTVWERGSQAGGPGAFSTIPFETVVSWETWADRVYLSNGRAFEVRVFDGRGTLVGILREDQGLEPVTDNDTRIHLEQRIADDFPLPEGVPIAETFGAYQRLVASHEGELWAQWVERPSQPTIRWTVYSSDGPSARGVVTPKARVHAIRDGKIYAAMASELGIQTIVVFPDPGA
jgi:hypothetical protein